MTVTASFVVGRNNASTLGGLSSPLSTPEDRDRFLARHRSAGAFIIGKESAAVENYSATHVPIFVFSRNSAALNFAHPLMQQITVDRNLAEITRIIDARIPGEIVVEAGARLLLAFIEAGVVDYLELSRTPIDGDGHFVDVDHLLSKFEIEEDRILNGTQLLKCRYEGDATNGKYNA
jgi:riboflavin biosynthesis pyrimidine reductase